MPTYIDESGDTGRVAVGGSPYFRLAAVWAPTDVEAGVFQEDVRRLRHELGLKADHEFKFARTTSPRLREAFFKSALSREFRFVFTQIDKREERWERASGDDLFRWCVSELAIAMRPAYDHRERANGKPLKERVVVDDNRSRGFLRVVRTEFASLKSRAYDGRPFVKAVEFRESHTDPWLQLADMVCGAAGSRMDQGDSRWYEMIVEREVNALSRL